MAENPEAALPAARVYIVSDSLGETAERVVRGAAIQFAEKSHIDIERVSHVSDTAGIDAVIARALDAGRAPAVIVYTLVQPELRGYLAARAQAAGVAHVDVLGPVLTALEGVLGVPPRLVPGLSHRLDRDYFARVEAVEFAVRYDDGKDAHGIRRADVLLLGVSRTTKTPVSLYLANHGLKVANIPLVPEVAPPEELFTVGRSKAVGLTIDPDLLVGIRRQRLKALGLGASAQYASRDRILYELSYAWDIYHRLDCPVVDVSNHAIEETASRVLEIVRQGR